MDTKLRNILTEADKFLEDLPKSELSPEISAQVARVQAQGQYLRSDAYQFRLSLWSTLFAVVIALAIVLAEYQFLLSTGMSPAKLHKGFYQGLAIIAVCFVYSLWKIWRKAGNRAA